MDLARDAKRCRDGGSKCPWKGWWKQNLSKYIPLDGDEDQTEMNRRAGHKIHIWFRKRWAPEAGSKSELESESEMELDGIKDKLEGNQLVGEPESCAETKFRSADVNADGMLSLDEYLTFMEVERGEGAIRRAQKVWELHYYKFDRDSKGHVTLADLQAYQLERTNVTAAAVTTANVAARQVEEDFEAKFEADMKQEATVKKTIEEQEGKLDILSDPKPIYTYHEGTRGQGRWTYPATNFVLG